MKGFEYRSDTVAFVDDSLACINMCAVLWCMFNLGCRSVCNKPSQGETKTVKHVVYPEGEEGKTAFPSEAEESVYLI